MGYKLLVNGLFWGYNPLTNPLLTSWDILVAKNPKKGGWLPNKIKMISPTNEQRSKPLWYPIVVGS